MNKDQKKEKDLNKGSKVKERVNQKDLNKGSLAKHKKVYLKGQIAEDKNKGVKDFDPVQAKKYVESVLKDRNLIKSVPKFLLTK